MMHPNNHISGEKMAQYKFHSSGYDILTVDKGHAIILDIDKTQEYPLRILYWHYEIGDYLTQRIKFEDVLHWLVFAETSEKQKRQQKLFQQLGNAHRVKKLLDEIFSNSVDVLTQQERGDICRAQYIVELKYIPMLQAQMRNL